MIHLEGEGREIVIVCCFIPLLSEVEITHDKELTVRLSFPIHRDLPHSPYPTVSLHEDAIIFKIHTYTPLNNSRYYKSAFKHCRCTKLGLEHSAF